MQWGDIDIVREPLVGEPRRKSFCHAPDLPLTGEKREDRALLIPEGLEDGRRHLLFDPLRGITAEIVRLDRIGTAFASNDRGIAEQLGDPGTFERCRHDDDPQITTQRALGVESQGQAEIGVE